MRASTVMLMCGCLIASAAGAQSTRPDSTAPAHILVVGNEYAFSGIPSTVEAGRTLFSFENHGKVRHEMSMILLRPDVTVKEALDRPSATGKAIAESLTGLLIARPSEAGGGQLLVDLRPGQRYLVVC